MHDVQITYFDSASQTIYVLDLASPSGWKSYGNDCYKLHEEKLTWEEAKTTCEQNHKVKVERRKLFFYHFYHLGLAGNSRK